MATFAAYPASTMPPSQEDDFPLYSMQEWNGEQQYPPTSTFADQSYLNATTFDTFQAQTSFAPLTSSFDFAALQPAGVKAAQFALRSPEYSPLSHSCDLQNAPLLSDSGASVPSTISSTVGSPSVQPQSAEWHQQQIFPGIVSQADGMLPLTSFDFEPMTVMSKNCVDPSLIQPFSPQPNYAGAQFGFSPAPQAVFPHMPSPAPSGTSAPSPSFMARQSWQPYPQPYNTARRASFSSQHSRHSSHSLSSDDSNKGLCPIATCGRHVKDLKAHLLTHKNERPEKCPIPTCEYHTKGFARKYDKNRHTLTHYKGTMVCGFCPGSGSAAEKSFNRADVFKRHLTTVHGVEQTPPNARKKSPAASGKKSSRECSGMCSTCGNTFANAQDFYEHLDDCVLRVVSQTDPSETVNEQILSSMADDKDVQETLQKHMLPADLDYNASTDFADNDEAEDDEAEEDDLSVGGSKSFKRNISSSGAICKSKANRKGLTHSKGGVHLTGPAVANGGKRNKRNFPLSWGTAADKMKMKKRVMCAYDGQRRLWKDDMMLNADHEVRIPLPDVGDGRGYVTDLDVLTIARAEAILDATAEEKGPWAQEEDLELLMQ